MKTSVSCPVTVDDRESKSQSYYQMRDGDEITIYVHFLKNIRPKNESSPEYPEYIASARNQHHGY